MVVVEKEPTLTVGKKWEANHILSCQPLPFVDSVALYQHHTIFFSFAPEQQES